ncbi:MAG: SCP2 sterol-binding domain-containing protein [Acidimicrobiales bacterium]
MAAFASQEWIDDLTRAAAGATIDADIRLTIEQRITGPSPISWHVAFADGVARVAAGPAADPSVTLTSSFETAAAIHAGRLSAQRAFLDGALRIGGDLDVLISHRGALDEIAELLGAAI